MREIRDAFRATYGSEPRLFSAPGRVNLIGEHTDYNDGFVMPIAIGRRTTVAAAPRPGRSIRARSLDLDASCVIDLEAPAAGRERSWVDYVEGVARILIDRGHPLTGADLLIQSDVPIGAGLSSSAALEVAVGLALVSVSGQTIDRVALAQAAQAAEHVYTGTRCGIMDQYIAALAQPGHALLIDCRSLEALAVPADLRAAALLVCDSRVKHALASSEYNTRRAECERGAARMGVPALRDATPERLAALSGVTLQRCRHVVTENQRTLAAADALRAGDSSSLGRLMVESHHSLRDDYEVSCPELDLLVDVACRQPGVYGSRLTGAGFGGCTVTLVEQVAADAVGAALTLALQREFGTTPTLFATTAGEGATEMP